MKRTQKPTRTSIVKHTDTYHICYSRDNGYSALIDSPYFSAIYLGHFDTQTLAQTAIDEYRYNGLKRAA